MNAPLRLGLVGYGKIARDQHVPAIAAMSVAKLVAVADPGVQVEGVPCYHDIAAMLTAQPDIAAIAMCQPPQFRFAAARAALLAGKHVFLEKPPGATLSEVEALIEIAAAQGVTLFAGWHSRFAPG
ncbi:MAG: Gfo/Idh/MocA family oxidoreductase, partial [Novosphingobium sp.]